MDKREEILLKEFDVQCEDCRTWAEDIQIAITLNPDVSKIKNAMDENGRRLCLDLLEYMAKNTVSCRNYDDGKGAQFWFRGELISKEELFQNFL